MNLLAFRVREFRSVDDSGWIETDDVSALIGTNESGKTNVLMPLWKLKPAKGGAIDPMADYPRKRYHEIRAMKKKPTFIDARFELPPDLRKEVATLLRVPEDRVQEAIVSRDFDNKTYVRFPKAAGGPTAEKVKVLAEIDAVNAAIVAATVAEGDETTLRDKMTAALATARQIVELSGDILDATAIADLAKALNVSLETAPEHSLVAARFAQTVKMISGFSTAETDAQAARDRVWKRVPSFVYYSNYGNLDSEIYLPHVIENLKRTDLGQKEQAKARTLKVLFDFVKLSPKEIQEMGQDITLAPGTKPTAEQQAQIEAIASKKKERDILLQSASTELTRKFREWWKQGDYRFRFAADGNHFRIWVSDDKRPEDIELEARSTGLQWFFSFYLVFLVESEDSHEGAILLLDEPGLTLHPLAQYDLSTFFDGLADTNQLIYTTHSPFMVDADHLDRARSVYTNKDGVTQVSPDLRAPADQSDQAKSVYAAYAAVGMSVSDTVLLGCQAVIVEGPSDQHYLSAIKNYLIGKGHLQPSREILFMPSGGVKGVKAVCALVMGKDDELPFALLDSDAPGVKFIEGLKTSLYQGAGDRVLGVGTFVSMANAEIEDLFPPQFLARLVDRYLAKPAGVDEDFSDVLTAGAPFVPQVESYAAKHGIQLAGGWKVDVARRAKTAILRSKTDPLADPPFAPYIDTWRKLFGVLHRSAVEPAPVI